MEHLITDMTNNLYNNIETVCIQLANNDTWVITYVSNETYWLKKLAYIMELKIHKSIANPNILVYRNILSELPTDSFKSVSNLDGKNFPTNNRYVIYDFNYIKYYNHLNFPYLICDIGKREDDVSELIKMQFFLYPIYEHIIKAGGLPIHAALIERYGKSVIIGASGGTGKSTCCNRISIPWRPLCDDLTLIVMNKYKEYYAHPFPTWSEYLCRRSSRTWNVQMCVPLNSIFFLEHSEEDKVITIKKREGAFKLYQLSSQICDLFWRYMEKEKVRKLKKKLFENAWDLAISSPCYVLQCNLIGEFWKEIEKVL